MSSYTTDGATASGAATDGATASGVATETPMPVRRISTETKSAYKTTELIVFALAVLGVLIASAVADETDYGTQEAWFHITLLAIGYMVSRGLAKSGSREPYDDDRDAGHR
ncbi:MAG: hypothetical protein AVDCRST_MAG72-470 [uncultured Nocardioidaceae bacterium]|uniref:Uncharacterized protein n=2 Tax=uncultured Nocardioidaceae bacterium TaxID=253824 RepID=A0A6J4LMJ8_9ACTN|nr:MAG: hypothetical protein AVDCRST_MAG72-470 [uncultured Nocardioidaceae bacterium]